MTSVSHLLVCTTSYLVCYVGPYRREAAYPFREKAWKSVANKEREPILERITTITWFSQLFTVLALTALPPGGHLTKLPNPPKPRQKLLRNVSPNCSHRSVIASMVLASARSSKTAARPRYAAASKVVSARLPSSNKVNFRAAKSVPFREPCPPIFS